MLRLIKNAVLAFWGWLFSPLPEYSDADDELLEQLVARDLIDKDERLPRDTMWEGDRD